MPVRHVALPTPPAADVCLPSGTPLESTLAEVFILNSLNPFRMNSCHGKPPFAQFWCNVSPFRINTCKSASKQTTLTPFRMNTYEKTGGGGTPGKEISNFPVRGSANVRRMRHVAALSPVCSLDCAYFLSPRGCVASSFQPSSVQHPESVVIAAGEFADDVADEILGVAEEHQGLIQVVQRVVDAGEAGSHAALDDHHG